MAVEQRRIIKDTLQALIKDLEEGHG
jgi:hypothetical protein